MSVLQTDALGHLAIQPFAWCGVILQDSFQEVKHLFIFIYAIATSVQELLSVGFTRDKLREHENSLFLLLRPKTLRPSLL